MQIVINFILDAMMLIATRVNSLDNILKLLGCFGYREKKNILVARYNWKACEASKYN